MPPLLLKLDGIHKSYGGIPALKPIRLELGEGEVLGLVGENGAGKSTLIKILSGVCAPDGGRIEWRGQTVRFRSPQEALAAGIATIHQELAYFGHLTVTENLLLGDRWPRRTWGGVDWPRLFARAAQQLAEFQIDVTPEKLFRELSAAQRQEVAIARALSKRAQLLILDEPTASLSEREVEQLFVRLQRLRATGVAIIYVSHRLDEILQLTDQVAVLRDGELVASYPSAEATVNRIVRDMVGRPLDQVYPRSRRELGPVRLQLTDVSRSAMFQNVSFSLHAGEIVGLAGLVGSGRSELARAIYGLYPVDSGTMLLGGKPWQPSQARSSLCSGLIYVPEERKRQGFVLEHSVGDSISIGFSDRLARWGLVPTTKERSRVAAAVQRHAVRTANPGNAIGTLSGGNQQKSLLARWLEREPEVLILDEPTRGVDVGAKAEIHQLIDRLACVGKAVLLISSDLPEVLGMSDRVLVMHRGRVAAELQGSDLTQEKVILAASGFRPNTAEEADTV